MKEDSGKLLHKMVKEDINETCTLCEGTGKWEGECWNCNGTGKNVKKLNQRPICCFFCWNTGKCKRCKGTKVQKKHRILGEEIKCKKCEGTGICSVCKDAPNGGYYMIFFLFDQGPYFGQQQRELSRTKEEIVRLKAVWEKLKIKKSEVLSFEEFAKYPSANYMDRIRGDNWGTTIICRYVDLELNRYEKYLKKFE